MSEGGRIARNKARLAEIRAIDRDLRRGRHSVTPKHKAEALSLVTGPQGGRLQGKHRPTADEFCAALAHWPRLRRAAAVFWLTLAGGVR